MLAKTVVSYIEGVSKTTNLTEMKIWVDFHSKSKLYRTKVQIWDNEKMVFDSVVSVGSNNENEIKFAEKFVKDFKILSPDTKIK